MPNPATRVARTFAPNPATGYQPPPAGPGTPPGNVIAFPQGGRSSKLVRGLMDKDGVARDPYMEFLANVPDIMPGQVPDTYFKELVPDESVQANIPRAMAAHELTEAHEDPSADAYGGRDLESHRITDLRSK